MWRSVDRDVSLFVARVAAGLGWMSPGAFAVGALAAESIVEEREERA
ncbi:MAG TPA: hypothetical protein VK869_11555 [Rubrobacteraceae bacterium]|nr:hypothetical protein [Rubrobacteraceae bacterium]